MKCECWWTMGPPTTWVFCKAHADEFDSLKKQAVKDERERCAKIVAENIQCSCGSDRCCGEKCEGVEDVLKEIRKA